MKKYLFIALFLAILGIIVEANPTYDGKAQYGEKGSCTGGACLLQDVQNNTIFDKKNVHSPQGNFQIKEEVKNIPTTDGLSKSPFTYDANCQFGNCINQPTGK